MTTTPDDVNTPQIAVIGLLSTVALFAIIVLLVVVFYRVQARQEFIKDTSQPQVEVNQLAARQRASLADYQLLDKEKQVYAIPIDRAMHEVVAQRRENPEGPPGTEQPGEAPGAAGTAAAEREPAGPQRKGGSP